MARTFTSTLTVELIDRVTGVSRRVGAAMERLGGSIGDVTNPRTRLDAAMARNEAALARARGGLVDAAAGAWVLKGAFDKTTGAAMALEDKMADVGKVSDMNDAELKAFESALRRLSRSEIPLAVEELAELAAAASASGIADNDLEAFTRQVAKSAVAWSVSGDYAGESLAKIKSALGLTIDETARYADAINYLSDTSASEAPDLIEFARRVAADGKIAGFTNEQVLALGSSMIAMGAQSDVAATSLRNAQRALTRGASATNRQSAAFAKLGLNAEDVAKAMPNDALGQFLLVLDRIRNLDQHEQIATMSDLFGDEARALMPLLSQLDQVKETTGALSDETNYLGSVQKEFETRSRTGRYALQRFNNQLRDVAISMGQALLPAMKNVLEASSPMLLAFADWAQQNDKLVAGIAAAVGGLVALRVAIAGLRFVGLLGKGGALSLLSAGMTAIGATAGRLWAAAKASVALQQALARMGGGAGLTALQKIGVGLRGMLGAIPGMRTIGSLILRIGTAIAALGRAIPGVAQLARAFAGVGTAVGGVLRSIGLIGPRMATAATQTEAAARRMNTAISGIKMGALLGAAGMLFTVVPEVNRQTEATRKRWEESGAIPTREEEAAARREAAAAREVERKAQGAALAKSLGFPDPEGPDAARAKGGPISRGERVLVGEEGPEVITARRSGYVHPNEDVEPRASRRQSDPAAAPAAGPTSVTVNAPITIHAVPGESAEALARRIKEMLERETAFQIRSALADID